MMMIEVKKNISFSAGTVFDFGTVVFSEQDIIDFATDYDPLDFHLDKNAAAKSLFKGLVASGPHAFHYFYKNHWIPLFGKTVLCGLGVDNWRFLRPVYADMKVYCKVKVMHAESYPEKKSVAVRWYFEFMNIDGELFQHLEMLVLHKNDH